MLARHAVLLTERAVKHAHPERASRAEGSLLAASLRSPARLAVAFSPTDRSSNSFSCNTYRFPRKCCKQKTYDRAKPFSCNTDNKHRGGGHILVQAKSVSLSSPCVRAHSLIPIPISHLLPPTCP